jgi:hypothetical protein
MLRASAVPGGHIDDLLRRAPVMRLRLQTEGSHYLFAAKVHALGTPQAGTPMQCHKGFWSLFRLCKAMFLTSPTSFLLDREARGVYGPKTHTVCAERPGVCVGPRHSLCREARGVRGPKTQFVPRGPGGDVDHHLHITDISQSPANLQAVAGEGQQAGPTRGPQLHRPRRSVGQCGANRQARRQARGQARAGKLGQAGRQAGRQAAAGAGCLAA